MEIMYVPIVDIIYQVEKRRVVEAYLKVDSYGGKYEKKFFFYRRDWNKIIVSKGFWENQSISEELALKIEKMSEEEYFETYRSSWLSSLSDKDLIDEVNRRLKYPNLHDIRITCNLELK